jgi:iron complex transport system substrate-binding protein
MHGFRLFTIVLTLAATSAASAASLTAESPRSAALQARLTVRDDLGRTVSLPARVGRIVSIQPEITRMIVCLGGGDRLVGIDYSIRSQDHLFGLIFPAGSRLPVVSMSENGVSLEEVLRLKPDVVFASPFERQIVESLERRTTVPVLAMASMGRFARQSEILSLVGRVLGREERAAELTAYFDGLISRVREAVRDAPESSRPRVFLSFWGVLTKTPIAYDPVATAGGINVAEKVLPDVLGAVNTLVGIEQIIRWNPDFILVHGNYPPRDRKVTVESVLNDPRLASVKAVKAGKVRYTFGFWNWWDMAEVTVETLYLADLFHPGIFPGFDLEREGNAIFKEFYGIDGGFSSLCGVLRCREWSHD